MNDRTDPLDFSAIAPAGYYVALRIGFAFPILEHNALPEPWVELYTRQGLMLHDPVIRWLYGNSGTVRWSEIRLDDPRKVMAQGAAYGLRFGAAVTVLDPMQPGLRSFGSFARSDREFTEAEMQQLETRLRRLHSAKAPPSNLTAAELEALRMVKNGMLMKQIAAQLGVTEGAVKQRLKNAKAKLNARTSTQAATLASGFGLI